MIDPATDPVDLASPPETARAVFGSRLALAEKYLRLLAGDGVEQGVIGPGERDRLWDRHLINCALVSELLPVGAAVVDVGSGAGLPGVALACRREDLDVVLVESMQRRMAFLQTCVAELGLAEQVRVLRGRAEAVDIRAKVGGSRWVTARAVAPLDRLVEWCLPLLSAGGRLLALKGVRAEEEIREYRRSVRSVGGVIEEVAECGIGVVAEPTRVVIIRKL